MEKISIALLVIGIIFVLEGLFIAIYPKSTKRIIFKMFKNAKNIKQIGIIEFIMGAILVLIGFLL